MKFCNNCNRAIKKKIVLGSIVFNCICGYIEPTKPEDVLISNITVNSTETIDMYSNLIELAPYDRTTQLIKLDCPICGLDYLSQIRVGNSEIIVYRCKCGYKKIEE
jgi:DNA-directed RNA polymerase subunit M/transcription elongation factor TFIIS